MRRHAAKIWAFCTIFLVVGCAPTQEAAPVEDDNLSALLKPQVVQRPDYHAESDAISFGANRSRELTTVVCAGTEDPSACRKQADKKLLGYRGAFSRPDADEALVAVSGTAVLLTRSDGRWRVEDRAQAVDIGSCLLAKPTGAEASDNLLCRATATGGRGFGLTFFRLTAAEDGTLGIRHIDAPKATDVDTSLFAGWKSEDTGIEVRFHKETEVKGASTLDFGGPGECRYRTFRYERADQPTFVELDACSDAAADNSEGDTPAHSTRRDGQYENRLHEPIRARNRDYVMCYHHELDRLKRVAEQALADAEKQGEDEADDPEAGFETGEPEEPEPTLAGDIHVQFIIGSSGAPVSCNVTQTTLQNDNVETCLCHEIMKTPFPPVPEGKFVDVTYPFSFAPAAD
jgi:hypothetical protein